MGAASCQQQHNHAGLGGGGVRGGILSRENFVFTEAGKIPRRDIVRSSAGAGVEHTAATIRKEVLNPPPPPPPPPPKRGTR